MGRPIDAQDHAARTRRGHDEVVGRIERLGGQPEAGADVQHGKDAAPHVDDALDDGGGVGQRRDRHRPDQLAHVGGRKAVPLASHLEDEDLARAGARVGAGRRRASRGRTAASAPVGRLPCVWPLGFRCGAASRGLPPVPGESPLDSTSLGPSGSVQFRSHRPREAAPLGPPERQGRGAVPVTKASTNSRAIGDTIRSPAARSNGVLSRSPLARITKVSSRSGTFTMSDEFAVQLP